MVRAVLIKTAETRAETLKTKVLLRAAEMKTLRMIIGVPLRDQVKSTATREELKIPDVVRNGRQPMGKMSKK